MLLCIAVEKTGTGDDAFDNVLADPDRDVRHDIAHPDLFDDSRKLVAG